MIPGWALVLACRGSHRDTVVPDVRPPAPEAEAEARASVVGPRYWTEPGGLCLEIPEGWSGTTGPPPEVLALTQSGTGFGLEIRTWAAGDALPPREGFRISFEDPGGFRTVPLLAPGAATRTWESDDPTGPTIQAWYGELNGRSVEVAASFPLGRITEGREVVDPLLRGVCTPTPRSTQRRRRSAATTRGSRTSASFPELEPVEQPLSQLLLQPPASSQPADG
jgi:hypothetical protein